MSFTDLGIAKQVLSSRKDKSAKGQRAVTPVAKRRNTATQNQNNIMASKFKDGICSLPLLLNARKI